MFFQYEKKGERVTHEDTSADIYIEEHNAIQDIGSAVREVDEVLRAVCAVEDPEKGPCCRCPYRDYFFERKGESKKTIACDASRSLLDI